MKKIGLLVAGLMVALGFGLWLDESVSIIFALSFPFSSLAKLLRWMSLQGAVLNVLAIVLYIGISLIPLSLLLYFRRSVLNGVMLGLISLSLFVGLYFMINTHLLYEGSMPFVFFEAESIASMFHLAFSFIIYALILLFLFLKALNTDLEGMRSYLHGIFYGFIGLLTIYTGVKQMPAIIRPLLQSDEAAFIVFNSLYLIYATVIFALFVMMLEDGKIFILSLLDKSFTRDTLQTGTRVFKWSKTLIITSLVAQMLFNGYQIVFAKLMSDIHFTLDLPLMSLAVAFVFLGMSHYARKVLEMNDDHKMVI